MPPVFMAMIMWLIVEGGLWIVDNNQHSTLHNQNTNPTCLRISSSAFMLPIVSASLTAGGLPSRTAAAKSSASNAYSSELASIRRVSRGGRIGAPAAKSILGGV